MHFSYPAEQMGITRDSLVWETLAFEKKKEEFLLSEHQAKYGVKPANDILNKLRNNEDKKTVGSAMVTVSGTSTVTEENLAGNAMVTKVPDTIKPASRALGIAAIATFFKKKFRTEVVAAANKRLLGEILYTYWDDYGQFGNKDPRKTGPYSTQAYTGAKEYKFFDTPHSGDHNKRKNILLDGVE